ncbi:DUF5518 domain-containing protein [Halobellus marinus]|uniref:DUF5518 domain-containing protein n=1 Tax=Halobellus TaxID=1073986 RepID=UPI0028A70AB2|nr:DUF5518 domain-containing protein [Halobellus sp. DFY28]
MPLLTRKALRNGAIGGLAGAALGFVPLVLLVAPLLGGGVAGYLEGDDTERGLVAGAVAGVVMAALSTVVTGVILFTRFGDLPFAPGSPLAGFGVAALLSFAASLGQVLVASIGGTLGSLLAGARPSKEDPGDRHEPRWGVVAGSLVAGVLMFAVVTVIVAVVLEAFIWLSLLVALPIGFIAGAAVAILGYRYVTRGPDSTVNWRGVGIGVVAVVVAFGLLLGGVYALGQQRAEQSEQSTYEYQVTISADQTLSNATFYVPVPETSGEAELGERFVEDVQYRRETPAIRGYDGDPSRVNFTYELVDTKHGRMLAISADRIEVNRVYYREVANETMGWREAIPESEYDPSNPSMGVVDDGTFTFSVTAPSGEPIDTAALFGTEPLLSPQFNRTPVECMYGSQERHRCFEYDTPMYATYGAPEDTTVYVSAHLAGRNEWIAGEWTGNEYRERAHTELLGPGRGWYFVRGELEVGSGRYRD